MNTISTLTDIFGRQEASDIFRDCYDTVMTSMRWQIMLDMFKLDEYMFRKYPQAENKFSLKELLDKEYWFEKREMIEKFII